VCVWDQYVFLLFIVMLFYIIVVYIDRPICEKGMCRRLSSLSLDYSQVAKINRRRHTVIAKDVVVVDDGVWNGMIII